MEYNTKATFDILASLFLVDESKAKTKNLKMKYVSVK